MPTFGSLFAGIGGIDLGLERAGWTGRWQVEWDPYCQHVLAHHWPDVPRFGDIRTVHGPAACPVADAGRERVRADIGHREGEGAARAVEGEAQERERGRDRSGREGQGCRSCLEPVDLIAGGFPCQPWSVAGKRQGTEDDRWLWPEFERTIRELRPRYVLVENVPGLLAGRGGMGAVLGGLAALGYDAEWDCIPASAVGAPHRRDRVWIVAHTRRLDRERWSGERGGPEGAGARDRTARPGADALHLADVRRPGSEASGHRAYGSGAAGVREADRIARRRDPGNGRSAPDAQESGLEGRDDGGDAGSLVAGPWEDRGPVSDFWLVEPDVGRVAHGVPGRVDRLRALGNAVVPQVVEAIGRRIMTDYLR